MGKSSNWNSEAMQQSLISDMRQEIEQGRQAEAVLPFVGSVNGGIFAMPSSVGGNSIATPQPTTPTAVVISPTQIPKEPTKGIQTDVPMSLYQRLVMMKLRRGEPICSMMIQALRSWLDEEEKTYKQ